MNADYGTKKPNGLFRLKLTTLQYESCSAKLCLVGKKEDYRLRMQQQLQQQQKNGKRLKKE